MSFIDIKSLVDDGRKSLENNQYWSALAIALMLPSVCSDFVYCECGVPYIKEGDPDKDKDRPIKQGEKTAIENRYIGWCLQYMKTVKLPEDKEDNDGWLVEMLGDNFGEVIYILRCDYLHAANILAREHYVLDGGTECKDKHARSNAKKLDRKVFLTINDSVSYTLDNCVILNVEDLCNTIFDYVDIWYHNWGGYLGNNIRTFIFDCSNIHDKHKLDSLIEQSRSGGK